MLTEDELRLKDLEVARLLPNLADDIANRDIRPEDVKIEFEYEDNPYNPWGSFGQRYTGANTLTMRYWTDRAINK